MANIEIDEELEGLLWDEYNDNPSNDNRNDLFDLYYELTEAIARRFFGSHSSSSYDFDDILQYASLAMLDCVGKYDKSKSSAFITYANSKVYFGIIDNLRKYGDKNYNTRSIYTINVVSIETLKESVERDFSNSNVCLDLGEAPLSEPETQLRDRQFIELLIDSGLDKEYVLIVKLFYIDGFTEAKIAKYIGCSSSKINILLNTKIKPFIHDHYIIYHNETLKELFRK